MSNPDVVNWPDRIDEFAFFRVNDRITGMINALEEVVMEDTSADEEYTRLIVDDSFDGMRLPNGVVMVRMQYDGQSDRQCVLDHWAALLQYAQPGEEIIRDARLGVAFGGRSAEGEQLLAERAEEPAPMLTREQSFEEHRRRRQNVGELVTRRQREAAERRRREEAPPQFRIQWDDIQVWHTPDGVGRHVITEMEDAFLWHTVIWLVRNQVRLAYIYTAAPPHVSPALASATWLRQQPAFRALLKESIRRCFTFPQDVFNYCKQYVLDKSCTLDGYQPWHDPMTTEQPKELEALLDMPDVPPELDMNKDLRSIEL